MLKYLELFQLKEWRVSWWTRHDNFLKSQSSCEATLSMPVPSQMTCSGFRIIRLKQWNILLNLDFHDFSITKCCLSINWEQHKYSWILSGAVWWNGLLFEFSSSLLNLQHLCILVLIRWYLVPSSVLCVAACMWCLQSDQGMWAENLRFRILLQSLDSDQLWHPLLSPFIVIPLLVLGHQKVWGRKAPWDPGRSLRSSWHREEQVWRARVQISQETGLVG